MKMNRTMMAFVLVLALFASQVAVAAEVNIIDVLLNGKTAQSFTDESVSDADLNTILLAGINAQSAMNSQPWHFSVIADDALLEELGGGAGGGRSGGQPGEGFTPPEGMGDAAQGAPGEMPAGTEGAATARKRVGMADAAVAIVVSSGDSLKWNSFDAGGACDRMSVAAMALGYSTRIVASPCDAINASGEYKALLGTPSSMTAMAVLLIGKSEDATDAISSASVRNDIADVVTFVNAD